jgi:hypothetical protein
MQGELFSSACRFEQLGAKKNGIKYFSIVNPCFSKQVTG